MQNVRELRYLQGTLDYALERQKTKYIYKVIVTQIGRLLTQIVRVFLDMFTS